VQDQIDFMIKYTGKSFTLSLDKDDRNPWICYQISIWTRWVPTLSLHKLKIHIYKDIFSPYYLTGNKVKIRKWSIKWKEKIVM